MITGLITVKGKQVLEVNQDPSLNATPSPIGSIAMFDDLGVGKLFIKTGALDTDWSMVQANANATWNIGGNTLGADIGTFGTVDNFDVDFIRNNEPMMSFIISPISGLPAVLVTQTLSVLDNALVLVRSIEGLRAAFQTLNATDVQLATVGAGTRLLFSVAGVQTMLMESAQITANVPFVIDNAGDSASFTMLGGVGQEATRTIAGGIFEEAVTGLNAVYTYAQTYQSTAVQYSRQTGLNNLMEDLSVDELVLERNFVTDNALVYQQSKADYIKTVDDVPVNSAIVVAGLEIDSSKNMTITAVIRSGNEYALIKKSALVKNIAGIESVGLVHNVQTDIPPALMGVDVSFAVVADLVVAQVTGLPATNISFGLWEESVGLEAVLI